MARCLLEESNRAPCLFSKTKKHKKGRLGGIQKKKSGRESVLFDYGCHEDGHSGPISKEKKKKTKKEEKTWKKLAKCLNKLGVEHLDLLSGSHGHRFHGGFPSRGGFPHGFRNRGGLGCHRGGREVFFGCPSKFGAQARDREPADEQVNEGSDGPAHGPEHFGGFGSFPYVGPYCGRTGRPAPFNFGHIGGPPFCRRGGWGGPPMRGHFGRAGEFGRRGHCHRFAGVGGHHGVPGAGHHGPFGAGHHGPGEHHGSSGAGHHEPGHHKHSHGPPECHFGLGGHHGQEHGHRGHDQHAEQDIIFLGQTSGKKAKGKKRCHRERSVSSSSSSDSSSSSSSSESSSSDNRHTV